MIASGSVLRAFGGLVAVLVLLALFVKLVRQGTIRFGGLGPRGPLAIETALALGERRSLVIVTVEGRRLLLGMTPSSIALVTELGPPAWTEVRS